MDIEAGEMAQGESAYWVSTGTFHPGLPHRKQGVMMSPNLANQEDAGPVRDPDSAK